MSLPGGSEDYRKLEFLLFFLVASSGLFFLGAILFVLAVPVNTYQHGSGTVQFAKEMSFVAGVEGVVGEIHKTDFDSIAEGEPVITYANIDKADESALMEWRISQARKELQRMRRLQKLAAIRAELVEEKEILLKEMIANKSILDRRIVGSPRNGRIYFTTSPSELLGSYVTKGQVLGSIYWSGEMVLKIEFPSDFIDRFRIGSRLVAYYRDPASLVSRHLWAEVRSIAVDKAAGKTILYASESGSRKLEAMKPGTRVKTSVILGSRSFLEDVFGFDLEKEYAPAAVRQALRRLANLLPGPEVPP
jgi:hypothetical protein